MSIGINSQTIAYNTISSGSKGVTSNASIDFEKASSSKQQTSRMDRLSIVSNIQLAEIEKVGLSDNEKLEAFKKEVWKELNSLPWNNSVNASIQITDSAFERMMTDEDFKNRIMKIMHEEASVCRPPIVSSLTWIDENGYRGISYNDYEMGHTAFNAHSKSRDSFYVRKAQRDSIQEVWEKARENRNLQREKDEKRYMKSECLKNYYKHLDQMALLFEDGVMNSLIVSQKGEKL